MVSAPGPDSDEHVQRISVNATLNGLGRALELAQRRLGDTGGDTGGDIGGDTISQVITQIEDLRAQIAARSRTSATSAKSPPDAILSPLCATIDDLTEQLERVTNQITNQITSQSANQGANQQRKLPDEFADLLARVERALSELRTAYGLDA